jgi:polyhydroxyalkanoate synthesis regulator phasin
MDGRARVGSIAALEDFRAALIRYTERARRALDDVTGEVKRTRGWLETEQRQKWEGEYRRRARLLEHAEQELYSARMSSLRNDKSAQQMAVNKARRALAEAEEKLAVLKRWRQAYDTRVEALSKQLDSLQDTLSRQMPRAAVSLTNSIRHLQAYAEVHAPPREPAGEGPGESSTPADPS